MKLKLVIEGDSPPPSPRAESPSEKTFQTNLTTITVPPNSFLHSTPIATETHPAPVATVMSVLKEQEAELLQRETELEERLQREAEERLATRIAYIRSDTHVVEGRGGVRERGRERGEEGEGGRCIHYLSLSKLSQVFACGN